MKQIEATPEALRKAYTTISKFADVIADYEEVIADMLPRREWEEKKAFIKSSSRYREFSIKYSDFANMVKNDTP